MSKGTLRCPKLIGRLFSESEDNIFATIFKRKATGRALLVREDSYFLLRFAPESFQYRETGSDETRTEDWASRAV
jgi:hypothetical protein